MNDPHVDLARAFAELAKAHDAAVVRYNAACAAHRETIAERDRLRRILDSIRWLADGSIVPREVS